MTSSPKTHQSPTPQLSFRHHPSFPVAGRHHPIPVVGRHYDVMMRQSDNWEGNLQKLLLPQLRDELRKHHVVTDTDRLEVLQQSGVNAPCKLARKKVLLSAAMRNKSALLGVSKTIDAAFNTELTAALSRTIPITLRGLDNHGLAQHVLSLAEPMELFALKMREQQETEGTHHTRSGGEHKPNAHPPPGGR